jgi:hypothetical protein
MCDYGSRFYSSPTGIGIFRIESRKVRKSIGKSRKVLSGNTPVLRDVSKPTKTFPDFLRRRSSNLHDALRVERKDFSPDGVIIDQPLQGFQLLETDALWAVRIDVLAIAAEHQFVLMTQ